MKITRLKVFHVNPGLHVSFGTGWSKNWTFVKIYTNEGIDGIGEAFGTGKAKTIEAALFEFERWLKGKDPTEVIRNWQAYYRGSRYPLGTATMAALSAVEQALWDISGKTCGLPVYKMLGGPFRYKIRVYASGYLVQPRHFDRNGLPMVEAAKDAIEAGFTAIKIMPQPDDYKSKSSQQVLRESIDRIRVLRETLGDNVDICLDYHGRSFSPVEAIKLAKAIEQYNPLFIEEPVMTENPDSLVEIKLKTTIPIAGGERCISRDRFREIIEKRALHIFQPEPIANGGILETIKWAAIAELYHIMIAPHHACSPVALVTCAHIDACLPNFLIQECNVGLNSPFVREVIVNPPVIKDGYLELPKGPGLGIKLNEKTITKYQYKPFDRPVIIQQDGSVGLE